MVMSKTALPRWTLPFVAIAAGWLGGHLSSLDLASEAHAASAPETVARLVAEDDIRQQIARYGLYVDGDGAGGRKRDMHALATTLMTPDVVSELHPANGSTPIILNGRDVITRSQPALDPERAKRIAGRHYLLNTVFDAITATTARTRTTAVYFDATKNLAGPQCATAGGDACGGVPVKTYMWVYEMDWRRTVEGWQISKNTLRNDN